MAYDPFARGPHPVGVRTLIVSHELLGDRPAALELWYPAQRSCRGRDLDDRTRDQFLIAAGPPVGCRWPGSPLLRSTPLMPGSLRFSPSVPCTGRVASCRK